MLKRDILCNGHITHYGMEYLCMAATSVATEGMFHTSGNIISSRRNKLTAENVDMLTFLSKNV